MLCTANASKRIEKYFLNLEYMFLKILEYFSQNKKSSVTEKSFDVPLARKMENISQNKKYLLQEENFSEQETFLISRGLSLFCDHVLNQYKFSNKKTFLRLIFLFREKFCHIFLI